ncbi:MAG: acetolactate synthase small subunit [Bacillota bacterium]|nr:acetolactate synthase small subunit [Bacillota bacterium]HHU61822.1 acetolactate synthase small subunit [Natronincola sp.]
MSDTYCVLSVLVNNESAVLARVSSLFSRRGFNIKSLVMGETERPEISRMIITFYGDDYTKDQMVKQLDKLHDVLKIELLDMRTALSRELLLVKVQAKQGQKGEILQASSVFNADVLEVAPDSLTLELKHEGEKIEGFIEFLKPYGIMELCRTGVTAVGRESLALG